MYHSTCALVVSTGSCVQVLVDSIEYKSQVGVKEMKTLVDIGPKNSNNTTSSSGKRDRNIVTWQPSHLRKVRTILLDETICIAKDILPTILRQCGAASIQKNCKTSMHSLIDLHLRKQKILNMESVLCLPVGAHLRSATVIK